MVDTAAFVPTAAELEEEEDPTALVPVKKAAPTGITHFRAPDCGPSLKPTDLLRGVNLLIIKGLFPFFLGPLLSFFDDC